MNSPHPTDKTENIEKNKTNSWYVYLLRCADNSLYAGITTDVARRLTEHNTCNKKGAKYTRIRRPVALAYMETAENRSTASQREYQLKKLSKQQKEKLVTQFSPGTLA